jgi:hypothetical protein
MKDGPNFPGTGTRRLDVEVIEMALPFHCAA